MKVILLKDIPRVGRKFDVKEIADGHAINYLIPRKLAEPATPAKLKSVELMKARDAEARVQQNAVLAAELESLRGTTVAVHAPANEHGHLFKGLKAEDIAHALSESTGKPVEAAHIMLDHPIKDVGTHEVVFAVDGQEAAFMVEVTAA